MAKKQTVIRLWSECDNKQIVGARQVTYGTELLHKNTHFLCVKPFWKSTITNMQTCQTWR